MENFFKFVIMAAVLIVWGYSMWHLARYINYNFSYDDLVTETIQKTVKQECLIK